MWHVVTLQLIGVGRVPMDTGSQLFEKGSIRWIQKWVLPTSEKSGMPRWHWTSVEASPLPKTNSKFAPENRPFAPKGSRIVFQPSILCYVSFGEGKPPNPWDQFTPSAGRHHLTASRASGRSTFCSSLHAAQPEALHAAAVPSNAPGVFRPADNKTSFYWLVARDP